VDIGITGIKLAEFVRHASGQLELLDFGIAQLEDSSQVEMAREAGVATTRESHPPYATKLRFVRRMDIPFPLVFQGASDLPDGRKMFQLNTPADGKTHFRALEEEIDGIVVKRVFFA